MTHTSAESILSRLKQVADQAEVFEARSESTEIAFEANAVKSSGSEETRGIALRAQVDGRLGFSAAAGGCDADELIDNALASAEFGDAVSMSFPGATTATEVCVFDPALADAPISDLIDIGRELIDVLLQADQDAKIDVSIERGHHRTRLQNSAGADTQSEASSLSISVGVQRVRGDDVLMTYDSVSDVGLSDSYREMGQRMAQRIELGKRSANMNSGRLPVLFAPKGAMALLFPLMQAINGKNVQRGISPLADRVGDQVFDARLTLWDDPHVARRPQSATHDDEGVPCYRKAPIDKGVCAGFLYDLRTAALMETESTGNGSRSLFSLPSPSPSSLIVEPGREPLASIVAGIDHGLLVEEVLGLGQGNPLSGAFSNTAGLAFAIEGGEIVGRVKDVSIAGNIYELLQEIAALSAESYWVYGRMRIPYILLPAVSVIAKDEA